MKFLSVLFLATACGVGAFSASPNGSTALKRAVGVSVPSSELMQGFPDVKKIDLAEYSKGKNMVIVGLPGAFTPT
jgi:peroxiredoxin